MWQMYFGQRAVTVAGEEAHLYIMLLLYFDKFLGWPGVSLLFKKCFNATHIPGLVTAFWAAKMGARDTPTKF